MRSILPLVLSIVFGMHGYSALAQTMSLPRIAADIVLDGQVNEPAWDSIEPLPLHDVPTDI